jgi:hypothetical protein
VNQMHAEVCYQTVCLSEQHSCFVIRRVWPRDWLSCEVSHDLPQSFQENPGTVPQIGSLLFSSMYFLINCYLNILLFDNVIELLKVC